MDARTVSQQRHSHSLTLPPAGFETLYLAERAKVQNCFQAFVLPFHWALIRGGLRLRITDTNPSGNDLPVNELSEVLPSNWVSKIVTKPEEGTDRQMNVLILRYWDQSNADVHYEAKILEVVKNQAIVVILFRAVNAYGLDGNVQVANKKDIDSNSPTRNSSGTNFHLQDYIVYNESNGELPAGGEKSWHEVYKNVPAFEKLVWEQLMEPIGLTVAGKNREPGPYENRTNERENSVQQNQSQQQPVNISQPAGYASPYPYPAGGIGGPLYAPPVMPAAGGLGRSDLDPVGGFGAGMIADPRGFRTPVMPFGTGGNMGLLPPPPGARFDPFGPPNPVPNPTPVRPGIGGGNWGVPNPDAEQPPPGFDDMFM